METRQKGKCKLLLRHRVVENKKAERQGIIFGVILFLVALACVVGADYVAPIWAEMMLLVSGVCMGAVAMLIVILASAVKPRKKKDAKNQHNQVSDPA
jgi:pilus assembly protein TadC